MRAVPVVVALEIEELQLQVGGRPEEGAVEAFTADRADQPFNERMRERHVRNGLDSLDVEDSQIRLPLVEPVQGIMIRADVCRRGMAARRAIEHAAQRSYVHGHS